MKCDIGSCQSKATFVVWYRPEEHEPDEYEADARWTCGRHAASVLTAMVRLYDDAVRVRPAPELTVQPRSVPGGTQGDPLVAKTVSRLYGAPDAE